MCVQRVTVSASRADCYLVECNDHAEPRLSACSHPRVVYNCGRRTPPTCTHTLALWQTHTELANLPQQPDAVQNKQDNQPGVLGGVSCVWCNRVMRCCTQPHEARARLRTHHRGSGWCMFTMLLFPHAHASPNEIKQSSPPAAHNAAISRRCVPREHETHKPLGCCGVRQRVRRMRCGMVCSVLL